MNELAETTEAIPKERTYMNTVTVSLPVHRVRKFFGPLQDVIKEMQELIDWVPEEHRHTATLDVDFRNYDEPDRRDGWSFKVTYLRWATETEMQYKHEHLEEFRKEAFDKNYMQYLKLKKQFEKHNDVPELTPEEESYMKRVLTQKQP